MSHEHRLAVVSHTLPGVDGKQRRVLVTCQYSWKGAKKKDGTDKVRRCMHVEVLRPHQGKLRDLDYAGTFADLPHLCCGGDDDQLAGVRDPGPERKRPGRPRAQVVSVARLHVLGRPSARLHVR